MMIRLYLIQWFNKVKLLFDNIQIVLVIVWTSSIVEVHFLFNFLKMLDNYISMKNHFLETTKSDATREL